MRFQDAALDGRAVVYAAIQADPLVARVADLLAAADTAQRVLARAVMNGEPASPDAWRTSFPSLFDPTWTPADFGSGPLDTTTLEQSEAILDASLAVAERGDEARNQYRGAIVEALTERLLARRVPAAHVRRERRILFDGVRAEIHPYDVTVELPGAAEAIDCKWGARGINVEVLTQLDAARANAESEGERLRAVLVIFDARRSCAARLARLSVPAGKVALVTIEGLDRLAGVKPVPAAATQG